MIYCNEIDFNILEVTNVGCRLIYFTAHPFIHSFEFLSAHIYANSERKREKRKKEKKNID